MNKFFVFLFVLVLSASFAAAEDEGIGLSAGLEFGIENVNKANDEDMNLYLMPMLIYENSFLDETLDVYAELDYKLGFTQVPNDDGDEVNPQSMYIDLMMGYKLCLGDASALSFILENEFDEIIISPRLNNEINLTGIFTPAVKFSHELDFGSLYAQIGLPITYYDIEDVDATTGLDFTLGWSSTFGLGIEAKICTLLSPGDYVGYSGFETTISYETESIYAKVETIIPKEIDIEGVTITPEFDYSFKNFTFYIKCEFAGIGADGGSVSVTPALGVKYSF